MIFEQRPEGSKEMRTSREAQRWVSEVGTRLSHVRNKKTSVVGGQ